MAELITKDDLLNKLRAYCETPDDETPDDETHPILLPKRIIRIPIHDRVYHYICECYKPVVSRSASSYWFISHRASSVDSI